MPRTKKSKENPVKYSLADNSLYCLKLIWQHRKSLLFLNIATIPLDTLSSLLNNFTASMLIALITAGNPIRFFFTIIGLYILSYLLTILSPILNKKIDEGDFYLNQAMLEKLNRKTMSVHYEYLESKAGQDQRQLALNSVDTESIANSYCEVSLFVSRYTQLLQNLLGLFTMSAIITLIDPVILLILAASTLLPYWLNTVVMKDEHRHRHEWASLGRKMNYIGYTLADWSKTKDIKLCGIKQLLETLVWDVIRNMLRWRGKYSRKYYCCVDIIEIVFHALLKLTAYGILISRVLAGTLSAPEFVFYFGVITGYASWLESTLSYLADFGQSSRSFCDFRSYLEQEEDGGGTDILPEEKTYEIEFENVCYRYSGAEADTLHNISLTIQKGETIALVGLNGAGKTTIVKLMCGLLRPTSGIIRIGGKNIAELDQKELFRLFSVVFQDIHLLPVSVRENISLTPAGATDESRMKEAVQMAGLEKRISEMKSGYDTLLVKTVREHADELSGGEKQKLALARALYKNGKIIVLDEPTAALDPIAENQMYQRYNELTSGRSSVFISHRLSSTRFCDRILMLENGCITESGSHSELMKKNGSYANLFNIQAHYYREGGKNDGEA
ncbi:MAG: ABC transporter ATP-binding protein [Clostridia bacterium]|nr:ABC transporter ATP-binding protein [Clostridia bacterium]